MPSVLLLALALNVMGWMLKTTERFPNRLIPATVILCAACLTPFLIPVTPTGEISPYLSNPDVADLVRRICIGLVVGFCSWGLHKSFLKRAAKWFGSFGEDKSGPEGK